MQFTVSAAQIIRLFLVILTSKAVIVDGASQQRLLRGSAVSRAKARESNLRSRTIVATERGRNGQRTIQLDRPKQARLQSRPVNRANSKPNQHVRAALVTKPAATVTGPTAALHQTSIPPPVVGGPTVVTKPKRSTSTATTATPLCTDGYGTLKGYGSCHIYPTTPSYCCGPGYFCNFNFCITLS